MYGYIYLTENLDNGKCYIGQHKSSSFDKKYKGTGSLISQAIKKYGTNNFITQLIFECSNQKELDEMEKYFIKKCNAVDSEYFYNLASGGYGALKPNKSTIEKMSKSHINVKFSEERKNKISESVRRAWQNKDKREKMINAMKGKTFTDEHRKKLSNAKIGKNNPMYGVTSPMKGKIPWNKGKKFT